MSAESPMIVFVGSDERRAEFEARATERSWYVYEALEDGLYGPLAQVVAFFPDAAIVEDTGDTLAHQVVDHLQSIQFRPLILLTDTPDAWDGAAFDAVLPRATAGEDVLDLLYALLHEADLVAA